MKYLLPILFLLAILTPMQAFAVNVCYKAGDEHDLDRWYNANTRAKLTNPAYFGVNGTAAPETLNLLRLNAVTASTLQNNNCQIWFGGGGAPRLNLTEAQTVHTWLYAQPNRFLLSGCDYASASYICNQLRPLVNIPNGGITLKAPLTQDTFNPLQCGGVSGAETFGGISSYQVPNPTDVVLATHNTPELQSAALTDSLTNPTFLMTADADMFGASGLNAIGAGATASTDQAKFIINAFKFAVDQVQGRPHQCVDSYEAGITLSGRVYNDSNLNQTADATENGIHNVTVTLINTVTNECQSTRTDANGNYQFLNIQNSDYQIFESANDTVPPQQCSTSANADPNGWQSTTANVTPVFTVADVDLSGFDFGDVQAPIFTPDHSQHIQPGTSTQYAHTFTPKTDGSVVFTTTTNNNTGWTQALYRDSNCDGQLTQLDTLILSNQSIPTSADTPICLINQVTASAALTNSQQQTTITANFSYGAGTILSNHISSVQDITTTTGSAFSLEILKTVQNLTQGTEATDTQNTGLPGDTLQYVLTYRNTGTQPLTDITVNDSLPAFTLFQAQQCGETPAGLICTPVINGESLEWQLGGNLAGGQSGTVSFTVEIE